MGAVGWGTMGSPPIWSARDAEDESAGLQMPAFAGDTGNPTPRTAASDSSSISWLLLSPPPPPTGSPSFCLSADPVACEIERASGVEALGRGGERAGEEAGWDGEGAGGLIGPSI